MAAFPWNHGCFEIIKSLILPFWPHAHPFWISDSCHWLWPTHFLGIHNSCCSVFWRQISWSPSQQFMPNPSLVYLTMAQPHIVWLCYGDSVPCAVVNCLVSWEQECNMRGGTQIQAAIAVEVNRNHCVSLWTLRKSLDQLHNDQRQEWSVVPVAG